MHLQRVLSSIYLALNTVKNPKSEVAISDILWLVNNTALCKQ